MAIRRKTRKKVYEKEKSAGGSLTVEALFVGAIAAALFGHWPLALCLFVAGVTWWVYRFIKVSVRRTDEHTFTFHNSTHTETYEDVFFRDLSKRTPRSDRNRSHTNDPFFRRNDELHRLMEEMLRNQARNAEEFQRTVPPQPVEDCWKILGIPPGSSQADIKRAFHKIAKECHPDTARDGKGDTKRFQAATEAYERAMSRSI